MPRIRKAEIGVSGSRALPVDGSETWFAVPSVARHKKHRSFMFTANEDLLKNKAITVARFEELGLTPRESDVLLWLAAGQSNAEIGATLQISARTVKKHLERVFCKLGVKTRLAAVVRATGECSPNPFLTRRSA